MQNSQQISSEGSASHRIWTLEIQHEDDLLHYVLRGVHHNFQALEKKQGKHRVCPLFKVGL
jgi:hypothetical protein